MDAGNEVGYSNICLINVLRLIPGALLARPWAFMSDDRRSEEGRGREIDPTWRAALMHPDPIDISTTDARRIQQPTLLVSGERSVTHLRAVIHRLS